VTITGGTALGNAAYKILLNKILGKVKPYTVLKKLRRTIKMNSHMEDL
jgi:hypothetical protein